MKKSGEYSKLIEESRPSAIIASARAFVQQSPCRPLTPETNLRRYHSSTTTAYSYKHTNQHLQQSDYKNTKDTTQIKLQQLCSSILESLQDNTPTHQVEKNTKLLKHLLRSSASKANVKDKHLLAETVLEQFITPIEQQYTALLRDQSLAKEAKAVPKEEKEKLFRLIRLCFQVLEIVYDDEFCKVREYCARLFTIVFQLSQEQQHDVLFIQHRLLQPLGKLSLILL